LISKAKTLITNDSAPVHIAGAFDNNIVLIPTCKHPDYILPFREGRKEYKSVALYKKIMDEDAIYQDGGESFVAVKEVPKGHTIWEYLPEVEDVLNAVDNF
jgi:ADP-heptose:LPS heptosyltransferase